MTFLLPVLLAVSLQDVSIDDLMRGWRFEDPEVRQAATDVILSRWQSWSDADLAKLAKAARRGPPEFSAQAGFVRARIGVRRALGAEVLERLPRIDAILDGGNEEQRFKGVKRAVSLWSAGGMSEGSARRVAIAHE